MTLNKDIYLDLESVGNIGTIHKKVLILSWCHLFEVDQFKIEMIVAKLNDTFNEQIPWLQHNVAVSTCVNCKANVSYLHNITAFQTQLGYGIKFRI